jgi:hypothetical protein
MRDIDKREIKIYTDASDYAIGGYVCQVIDDKEYPIEINFYEDKDWIDLKKVLEDFK